MTPEPAWVDLGLPSQTLWAASNLLASSLEDSGIYCAWGDIVGHRAGDGYNFSEEAYAASAAAAISEDIPLSRDIVHLYLGGSAVLPSELDFKELYDNCTLAWITINGRGGMQFTSNINGRTLFFPASGRYEGDTNERLNLNGDYMSRTYVSATSCKFMDFYTEDAYPQASSRRYYGYTIRPVKHLS